VSEKLTTKPITSPDKGSMPAGPCRAGVGDRRMTF
jgi:hypothetical protein